MALSSQCDERYSNRRVLDLLLKREVTTPFFLLPSDGDFKFFSASMAMPTGVVLVVSCDELCKYSRLLVSADYVVLCKPSCSLTGYLA